MHFNKLSKASGGDPKWHNNLESIVIMIINTHGLNTHYYLLVRQ